MKLNTNKVNATGDQPTDLKTQWEQNKAVWEQLCTEQEGLYNPEFERVFNALYEIEPSQAEVYNTKMWNIFADLPEAIDTDLINQALTATGVSDDVRRDFTRYAEVTLQGKRLQQENILLNLKIEATNRPQEQEPQPDKWYFWPRVNIFAPVSMHTAINDELERQAREGEGLWANTTEVEQPDEWLDEFLCVEVYDVQCSLQPYLDELRRYGVTGVTMGRDFTRYLFQLLKRITDHIKANTDKPEAVKSNILGIIKELDKMPIWGLIFQILTLQGLCHLLEHCTLKEGDNGYKEAQGLCMWLTDILTDKILRFAHTLYGEAGKERLQPLCDYLYNTKLGRAVQECLYKRYQDGEATATATTEGVILPTELDTERARLYFARAVEVGYMKPTATGYKWEFGGKRGALARLGYFVERVYCPTNTEQLPEQAINKLFGVTRIGSTITQVHNAKTPQKWRAEIDKLFND